jgi:NADP-dependent 3-hydroxy acid dehydrogenase YdfG
VSLAARTEAELQAVQPELESFGGQVASFPTDVSREAEVIKAML